ncbi:hypothetical protein FISHEDRAFT_77504 [Fistulina hepatica ATCC 64428]|uniref:Uncharacterized protein n=1 Tax=Fistulina hepatica ATCC 64428 TaxID=1128425 RepID=A0A0D7A1S5_9AGAR|nr:hypothetical protein FISHEDRAFT_77504 [Fistulina hepatica ATCC 64428]
MSVPSTSSNTVYYYAMIGGDHAGVYTEMIHSTPAKDKSLVLVPIIIKLYTVEDASRISNHLNKVLKHLGGASCTATDFMNFLIDRHHIIELDQILKDEGVLTSNKHQFYTVFESSNAVSHVIYCDWHTDIKPWSTIPGKYNTRYCKFPTLHLAIATMVLRGDEALLNAYGIMEATDRTIIYNNLCPASKVYDIQMDSEDEDESTGIYAESYNHGQSPAKSGHHPPSHLSSPQKRERVQVSMPCPTSQVVYNRLPPSLARLSAPDAHVALPPGASQVSLSSSLGGSPSLLSFDLSMDELTLQTSADDSEEVRNELLAGITCNDVLEPQATISQLNAVQQEMVESGIQRVYAVQHELNGVRKIYKQVYLPVITPSLGKAADRYLSAHFYMEDAIARVRRAWHKVPHPHDGDVPTESFIRYLCDWHGMPELEHIKKYNSALDAARNEVWAIAKRLHDELGGHSVQYYFQELCQHSHRAQAQCAISSWNSYLAQETKWLNEERGENKGSTAQALEIAMKWQAMSKEEKEAAVKDSRPVLEEQCAIRKYSKQNIAINAYHDVHANIDSIAHELDMLEKCTGTHSILITMRSSEDQFNYPTVYTTSNKGEDFMELTYNKSLTLFAKQFEAYLLSGVDGMIKSAQAVTMDKKKQIVVMILMKLSMFGVVLQLFQGIPYSVVVERWPLARFCGPHDINDKVQLNILYRALETGTTSFRRLTPSEKIEWEQGLIHSVTHADVGTAAPTTNDAAAMPTTTPRAASSIPQAAHTHIPPSSTPSGVQPLPSQPQVFISLFDELASSMSFTSASTLTITTGGGMTTGTCSFQSYPMAGYLPPPAGQASYPAGCLLPPAGQLGYPTAYLPPPTGQSGYPAAYLPPPAGQPYPVAAYLLPPADQSAAAAPLSTLFINMNTDNILKRKQKERTDKGMPHGPRKKHNADTGDGWPTPAL